jgi:hypothetical protein
MPMLNRGAGQETNPKRVFRQTLRNAVEFGWSSGLPNGTKVARGPRFDGQDLSRTNRAR